MALVNGSYLHYVYGHEEILKKKKKKPASQVLKQFHNSRCSLGDPFQNCSQNFDRFWNDFYKRAFQNCSAK